MRKTMGRKEKRRRRKVSDTAAKNAKPVRSANASPEQQTLTTQQALGLAMEHHNAGRLPQAESIYQQIMQADPSQPDALHLLGVIALQVGKNDVAVDLITKALSLKPDYAEAHSNLGNALQGLGELEEAVASYHKALSLKPDYFEAQTNLGTALQGLGEREDAVASCRKALAIKPDYAEAHYNLGIALHDLGNLNEAEKHFLRALELKADFPEALGNYGNLLITLGRWNEALEIYHRKLEMVRGKNPIDPNIDSFRFITKAKMKHDIEQFQYLVSLGSDADRIGELVRDYEALDKEVEWPDGDSIAVPLTDDQLDLVGHSYNRPLHLIEAPEVPGSALNRDLDAKSITRDYTANVPGMTYFDDFLNPEALDSLRRYLLESTIWYKFNYPGGYLGAKLADGLACPLLFQIAKDLRQTFPDIFKNHRLYQLWAYKYDSRLTGINIHADIAAVNVNFWITPDSANLNSNNGGLVVYKEKAPLDWAFDLYNSNKADSQRRIQEYLAEHDSGKMVVPYAENRIVLFNSNLFHESDTIEFKPGYENRRINVTLLFGNRLD